MYSKPEFAPLSRDDVFGLIEAAAFATVVTSGPQGLVVSHLPFVLDRTRGENGTLVSHLALLVSAQSGARQRTDLEFCRGALPWPAGAARRPRDRPASAATGRRS